MSIKRTYIQQLSFDGATYTKGPVVDLLSTFKIVTKEFPFKKNPEAKDLATRDWPGEDGRDVYVPDVIPMKNYDLEVEFLYKGTEESISNDISGFIDFIYGRNANAVGGRLVIYDEYTKMGRKDIHALSVDNDVYVYGDCDPDAVASFKIKFGVEDPTTDVTPKFSIVAGGQRVVSDLVFDT